MPDDLYGILEIPKDASDADIKRAYRKRSKELHPDTGGDADDFTALNRAYTILSDPETRGQYDRGEYTDPKSSGPRDKAIESVTVIFFKALKDIAINDVPYVDLMKCMREACEQVANRITKQERELPRMIEKLDAIRDRLSGNEHISFMLASYRNQTIEAIDSLQMQRHTLDEMREILSHGSYKTDKRPWGHGDRLDGLLRSAMAQNISGMER